MAETSITIDTHMATPASSVKSRPSKKSQSSTKLIETSTLNQNQNKTNMLAASKSIDNKLSLPSSNSLTVPLIQIQQQQQPQSSYSHHPHHQYNHHSNRRESFLYKSDTEYDNLIMNKKSNRSASIPSNEQ